MGGLVACAGAALAKRVWAVAFKPASGARPGRSGKAGLASAEWQMPQALHE